MSQNTNHLPREPIHQLSKPLARFLNIEAASGLILLVFAVAALVLSNSPWSSSFLNIWEMPVRVQFGNVAWGRSLKGLINDGLMTLFFFLVALELKRELVLGELNSPRAAALSIAAALGGMLLPATIYLTLQGGQPGERGWGVVMSTDTAFVIGCLAILGRRISHSLRVFLLSLAVIDDIGAILVVAIGYSSHFDWRWLTLSTLVILIVRGFGLLGVRSTSIYFLMGALIWFAIDASGVHPTVTGVILGLMTPTGSWISDERLHAILGRAHAYPPGDHWSGNTEDRKALRATETAAREALSPVERLEMALHPWVGFVIMPLFALANAGIPISFADFGNPVSVAVFFGFVLGKPLGIMTFSWLAVRLGIAIRSTDLSWGLLAASGVLAGIGFTMALLIAALAFSNGLLNAVKLGILCASVVSAAAGLAMLMWLSPKTTTNDD